MGAQTVALFSEAPANTSDTPTTPTETTSAADPASAVTTTIEPTTAEPTTPPTSTTAEPTAPPTRTSTRNAPLPTTTDQPKYGKELGLPGTYVRCGRCATAFAIAAVDLGTGPGRRISCGLCDHSWFQTPDRLFTLNDGHELIPLPGDEVTRIESNVKNGREPDFVGNAKFYVGNLNFRVGADDLRTLFATVGEVGGVSVVYGPDGRSKGFAFVTMMDEEDTDKCMALDGHDLMGRNINVNPPNN